jgi:hypothetical protein
MATRSAIAYPGPPTSGTFEVGEFIVDSTGMVWECTVAGSPGSFMSSATALDLAETIRAETAELAEQTRAIGAESADLPRAGGAMTGPIAMGANKITGLANGSASDDAAAFGQISGAGASPAATVTGPDALGASAVVGSGTTYARADHNHGLPAAGTTSGTVAAGDDSRIVGAAQKASNLSDLASAATARTNLGLGTAATYDDARYLRIYSPMNYGAVGNNIADDTIPLQNCAAASIAGHGIFDLGSNTYLASSPITISTGFHLRGAGFTGGRINNNTSDLFVIDATCNDVIIENCTLKAGATGTSGGHVWNASNGPTMSFWHLSGVNVAQTSTSHGIWYQIGGSWIDCLVDDNCSFTCSAGATVSPWSVLRVPGNFNSVKFSRIRCGTQGAGVPFFNIDPGYQGHIDSVVINTGTPNAVSDTSAVSTDAGLRIYSTAYTSGSSLITAVTPGTGYTVGTAAASNFTGSATIGVLGWDEEIVFDHVTFEVCNGGGIAMTGCVDVQINACSNWDIVGTVTGNFCSFTQSLTGYPCRNIQIRGGRSGGVYGATAYYDVSADSSCTNILIDSFGAWNSSPKLNTPALETTIINAIGGSSTPRTTTTPLLSIAGISSAVNAGTRFVGATTSGAPTSGTFVVGDFVIDQTGAVLICTAAGTPGTWSGSGSLSNRYAQLTTTGATWTVPAGVTKIRVRTRGGGGQGGGAGSTSTTTLQAGGAGGGAGEVKDEEVTVVAADVLTATIGAGGTGAGAGGLAGGNAGSNGANGGNTSLVDTTQSSTTLITAAGGGYGGSTASTSTTAANGGVYGFGGGTPPIHSPGTGGGSAVVSGPPFIGGVGGAGGGAATSTLGGQAGPASTVATNAMTVYSPAPTGNSGTAAGVNGTTATTPGCGGGGGGGGAAGTGAGGNGGPGAKGLIEIWW